MASSSVGLATIYSALSPKEMQTDRLESWVDPRLQLERGLHEKKGILLRTSRDRVFF